MAQKVRMKPYGGPAGGWGSARSLGAIVLREGNPVSAPLVLTRQNKPGGFMCPSCAWGKPAHPLPFEYCENGAKATAWELTSARIRRGFFEKHTVSELEGWTDYALEQAGRLTEPMRWDRATDRYVPVSWEEAFEGIGAELRAMRGDPDQVVFYASGRASNEASYMWQLLARLYGTNNLPDSSNMCHESTSVALPESIGVPVGTVVLEDFEHTDCLLFFGQNPGSNSPRMLHQLEACSRRGVPIVSFNPLRERGLERFTDPQNPAEMLTGTEIRISSQYCQLRAGGDLAAITGLCKAVLEGDGDATARGEAGVVDRAFVAEHTHGFGAFADWVAAQPWEALEARSGLRRAEMEQAARTYAAAGSAMGVYGMGLTQHRKGVETVQMLCNLLLLRGNIGRPGAGICPVRGHSNVQGQRAVFITEKPELAPLDTLAELFGFEPPRKKGMDTVETCEGVISGRVRAVFQLGGNLVRAVPDHGRVEPAWRGLRLTVMVSTKLNRSHLVHGEAAYLLPCLGRTERDVQATGAQEVSIEDSLSCIHASKGLRKPASPHLRSEHAIIAGMAKAALPPNPKVDWDGWVAEYGRVRALIERTKPEWFAGYEEGIHRPGGLHRPNKARKRVWETKTGRANFVVPKGLEADPDMDTPRPGRDPDVLDLITLRSNDQFNTTVYGYDDRFRGIKGTRHVVLMHRADMARLGVAEREEVALETVADDGVARCVEGLQAVPYDIPQGCVGGYYPECNPLIPLWHRAERSHVPAAKSIPVRVRKGGLSAPVRSR